MASLKRVTHKSGRVVYRIVICLGYDDRGRKMVKNLTYPVRQSDSPKQQEKEALKYALNMEDKIKYGHDPSGVQMLFGEFACEWLKDVRKELAYGTYVGYEQLLRSRIQPYFKAYRLSRIRTSDIEAFYATLTGDYSAGTIRRCANVLNCIFAAAGRRNLIEGNPCRDARKPKKRGESDGLRYFTPRQSLIFLKSLNISAVPLQLRVFYTLSVFCGLRKGETLALEWGDIDFAGLEISVSKAIGRTESGFDCKEPKNTSSVRRIPFPESILPLLEEYRQEYESQRERSGSSRQGTGNLFIRPDGRRMGYNTVYQHFVRYLKRHNRRVRENPEEARDTGMEELPLIPLHGLRHSCATMLNWLEVNIVDISKYLGHANCSTTMNIYAHSFEQQKRVASDKINDFIRNNS